MKSKHHTLDVELFERWGSTYERSWMQQRLFDPVHSAVLHQAASRFKPASVLDIGCGSGRLLRKMHDYWPEAHLSGVDPAHKMLEVARQLTPEARFSLGSGEALPLEDAKESQRHQRTGLSSPSATRARPAKTGRSLSGRPAPA